MTGTGVAAYLIVAILQFLGVDVDYGTTVEAIVNLVAFVSFFLIVFGQLRRKDLRWGFWRK